MQAKAKYNTNCLRATETVDQTTLYMHELLKQELRKPKIKPWVEMNKTRPFLAIRVLISSRLHIVSSTVFVALLFAMQAWFHLFLFRDLL